MLPKLHVGTYLNLGHISVRSRSAQGKLTVRYSGALFTLHACVALNRSSYRFKRFQKKNLKTNYMTLIGLPWSYTLF
jgi:hypothetical protein